jgi:hypothetical protein
MRGSMY